MSKRASRWDTARWVGLVRDGCERRRSSTGSVVVASVGNAQLATA